MNRKVMDDIAERVRFLVARHFAVERPRVSTHASFVFDFGADTMDAIELAMDFEEEFGVELRSDEAIASIDSLADAVRVISGATGERPMHVTTLGQYKHGKTTLTEALAKLAGQPPADASWHQPLPYKVTRTAYASERRTYLHSDCPLPGDYVRHLLISDAPIDAAILVVDASVGPMPQTTEHLLLARKVGVPAVVTLFNKVELLDDLEDLELAEQEVRDLLAQHGYSASPIIRGSALAALEGRDAGESAVRSVLSALDQLSPLARTPRPDEENIRFEAEMYVVSTESGGRATGIRTNHRARLQLGGRDVEGTIELLRPDQIVEPDEHVTTNISVARPMKFGPQQHFSMYEDNRVIAVGVVTGIVAPTPPA